MAFNAKNLQYEKTEPAFLRKLRGQHSSDINEVQIARPKKDRLKTADEDDGPTIVDESGEVVGNDEYEKMVKGEGAQSRLVNEDGGNLVKNEETLAKEQALQQPEKQKVAEIGGQRKRKTIKVVGDDVEDIKVVEKKAKSDEPEKKVASSKVKFGKKAKKMKLSFDEPED